MRPLVTVGSAMHLDEDFLRYTHGSVFCWYQQANSKAQVILGFTGVFLSILVGGLIAEYMRAGPSAAKLQGVELFLFVGAVACHLGAVMLSSTALWSRGVFASKDKDIAFFGQIANFPSAMEFFDAVQTRTAKDELYVGALATNVYVLSKNTRRKHQLVDAATVSSGVALVATMSLVVLLLIRPLWS